MTWDDTVKAYQEEILRLQLEEARYRRARAVYEMNAAAETHERAKAANRPAIMFGAELRRVNEMWIASAHSVWGRGESPEEAFAAFDRAWTAKARGEAANN